MFNVNAIALVIAAPPKRGKSDEAEPSVQIKLSVEDVLPAAAAEVLGVEDDFRSVEQAFFKSAATDVDRGVRFRGIKSIRVDRTFDGEHKFSIAGKTRPKIASIRDIELFPQGDGKFSAHMVVVVDDPGDGYLDIIAQQINRRVTIILVHAEDLFRKNTREREEKEARDTAQIGQAAKGLETAELPLKTARPRRAPAKKAAKKRPKKAA